MKLIIQIPSYNETASIGATLAALPRRLEGFSAVEFLVVDDGSSDGTAEAARRAGADHVLRLGRHLGLAKAFSAGIHYALSLGADVIVNTDADNQYVAGDIPALVGPVLRGEAHLSIGDRRPRATPYYSRTKKVVHALGSRVLSLLFSMEIPDAPSGFRALSREYAERLVVYGTYTYTVETLFHALDNNYRVRFVPVGVNPPLRPSRLFTSALSYAGKLALTSSEIYLFYRPLSFFALLSAFTVLPGFGVFLWLLRQGTIDPAQFALASLLLGTLALVFLSAGILCRLLKANRQTLEQVLFLRRRGADSPPGGTPAPEDHRGR